MARGGREKRGEAVRGKEARKEEKEKYQRGNENRAGRRLREDEGRKKGKFVKEEIPEGKGK